MEYRDQKSTAVNLAGVELKNPVMVASGTLDPARSTASLWT